MKIEVISDVAFSRLDSLSLGATRIRAVMAYWTILAEDLPKNFLKGLQQPGHYFLPDPGQMR